MNGAFRRSCPRLGDVQPPTLETLPQAVAQNVAVARSRTRGRIMAVFKADGYGHGACTVARAAVAARVAQSDSGTSLAAAAAALLGFTVVSSQKAADDALPVWWPVLALAVAAVGLFLLRRRFRRRNRQPVRSSGGGVEATTGLEWAA